MDPLTIIILFAFFGLPFAIMLWGLWDCYQVTKELQRDYNEKD